MTAPRFVLGVDVGGTHVEAARFDFDGARISDVRRFDPLATSPAAGLILEQFASGLAPLLGPGLAAIGFGFPGPFDYENGICRIRGLAKFDALYGLNLKEEFRKRLGLDKDFPIVFVNDATAFALGESRFGAAKGLRRAIVLTLGTGCGSTFLIDGRVATDGPGVPPNGWIYSLPFRGGIVDEHLSRRGILALWREIGGDAEGVDIIDLAGRAQQGDSLARLLFERFGQAMGEALAPVIREFSADGVVVGGQIAKSFALFAPAFSAELSRRGLSVIIRRGDDLDGSALKGAAYAALETVDPSIARRLGR